MIVGQVIIVLLGGRALQVVHISGAQWGYSIVLGFLSIPVAVLIRCFPDEWFQEIIPARWLASQATPAQASDWESVLEEIREEMKFISWVHGGRLQKWRRMGRATENGGMKTVAAMAGLIAGSIGGWPRGRSS